MVGFGKQQPQASKTPSELRGAAIALANKLAANTPNTRAEAVHVPLPPGCSGYRGDYQPLAVVLDNVFTEAECKELIALGEERGFEQALVNVGGGRQLRMDDVRNSKRAIVDSPEIAEAFWQRVKHVVPAQLPPHWHAVGLNERLRFLRYHPGEYFAPHMDGAFRRGAEAGDRAGEQSKITFQVYLQESERGGATNFLGALETPGVGVRPKPGRVLLFEHALSHEGEAVGKGVKYTIRTDVMYTNKGPGLDYATVPVQLASGGECSPSVF